MLAYEITRFNRSFNDHEEEDPFYIKKIVYDNPVEVFRFLETGVIGNSTVLLIVWDGNKFVASFTYGA